MMAEKTKNLCAQVPLDLHARVCEAREQAGQTTSQYITELLIEYYKMKENGGDQTMADSKTRTMAIQMSEEMFRGLKKLLERESRRTGKKVTQKQFVLDLIQKALDEAEAAEREEAADHGADLE